MQCSSGLPLHEHCATQPEQPPQVSLSEPTSGLATHTSSGDGGGGGAHWLWHAAWSPPWHSHNALQSAQLLQPVAAVHVVTGGGGVPTWQALVQ
jgi:hypothetical protein